MLDPVGATRIPSPSWSLSKDWSTNCFHHQRIHWLLIAFEIRPRCRIWVRIPHLGQKWAKSEKCIHIPRYALNSQSSKKKSCILLVFIWDYRMITYAIFSRFIHESGKEYYYRKELLICFSNLTTAAYWSSYAGLLYLWTFYSCLLRIARM